LDNWLIPPIPPALRPALSAAIVSNGFEAIKATLRVGLRPSLESSIAARAPPSQKGGHEARAHLYIRERLAMIDINPSTPPLQGDAKARRRRTAVRTHTVTRYKLRLIKGDEEAVAEPETLTRPAAIAAFLWQRVFEGLDREVMCAVYVDVRGRVIGWTVAYVGCLTRCGVEPRGIVVPALLANANAIIIAHNHPTGLTDPSQEDVLLTRRIHMACDVLGLELIDSMIIAEGRPAPNGLL
jgi:DNA repair protein RadC